MSKILENITGEKARKLATKGVEKEVEQIGPKQDKITGQGYR